jgi:glycosyltransferase involved in cell wall biosynthesis
MMIFYIKLKMDMMSKNNIDILISTYNGEEYLGEQLQSIIEQDINDWHIILRDDGSEDNTVLIAEGFASRYPGRMTILSELKQRLGINGSFEYLLRNSSSPYVAFCDQDDVWFSDKLRLLREAVQQVERTKGRQLPVLVHSDLQVVNKNLGIIADSFWMYQKLNPLKMQTLERLLVQNCVTGCATLVNRPLIKCALPIPEGVIMHDWWFALLAVSVGEISCISAKTVKYRQHEMNDTGAKEWNMLSVFRAMFRGRKQLHESIIKTRNQAKALLASGKLSEKHAGIVSRYINLFDQNGIFKRLMIIRMGFFKYGFIRNVGFILRV